MFAVKKLHSAGFDKVLLIDDNTRCTVEIIPECGAMLHAFTIMNNGVTLNIIDSYADKQEFDSNAESKGFKGLKLSPFPCRIPNATYSLNGQAYHFRKFITGGAAIHGLLYDQPFKIIKEYVNDKEAGVSLLFQYKGEDPGYPFPYDCAVSYVLTHQHTLTVTTTVHNNSSSVIPIADGWHPYFTFGKPVNELELQFQSEQMLEFVNLIPSGKILTNTAFIKPALIGQGEIDNSFVLDFSKSEPICILRDPKTKWQLEISTDKSYPYLQIYTPPHRKSIAIENLSAPPDAFNNGMGLIKLHPDESSHFTTSYSVKKA
ncbi:MAG: aldose 1-epimerase [Agriterribacter sp.]